MVIDYFFFLLPIQLFILSGTISFSTLFIYFFNFNPNNPNIIKPDIQVRTIA